MGLFRPSLELGGGVEVTVHVQLVHVAAGGGESVEWSGALGPFTVTPGVRSQAVEVPMVRGPPGNLSVTGITVQPNPPPAIFVDQTLQLTAEVTTSDPGVQPVVFWTSLGRARRASVRWRARPRPR